MPKKISNFRTTFKALAPILLNAIKSGQLFKPQCELTEPDPDILCEYDIEIPISEGFTVTANVFRSKNAAAADEKMPVVMCAHPYDNHLIPALGKTPFGGPPQQYRLIPQYGKPVFSTLTSWESPDPNFWVPAGYAVVNMNLPGYSNSGGKPSVFSTHQAKCFYEAIEWIASQPWCTGKVGLNGVSFLAITQYHVAACQAYGGPPPSLCCISPWEGIVSQYYDLMCRGGIPDIGFTAFWWPTELKPTINVPVAEFIEQEEGLPMDLLEKHPFYDKYWQDKTPKIEEITVPMLVCGSFSDHALHSSASFRAFMKAKSKYKWIYTHRIGKWDAYYSPEVQNLTRDFFDCFVKGDTSNGFIDKPPVRLEVRSDFHTIYEVRHESAWPPADTNYQRLYLDTATRTLVTEKPEESGEISYKATNETVVFSNLFKEDTELSGYMKLRLWVEARPDGPGRRSPDDMSLFAAVNKLDQSGRDVNFMGSVGFKKDKVTRGLIRVSRRELDPDASTEWLPVLKHTSEMKLKPGEVVSVDIEMCPSSTFFSAGETLQLIIASHDIVASPPYIKSLEGNFGRHVLHAGGVYDANLLVPVIPNPGPPACDELS